MASSQSAFALGRAGKQELLGRSQGSAWVGGGAQGKVDERMDWTMVDQRRAADRWWKWKQPEWSGLSCSSSPSGGCHECASVYSWWVPGRVPGSQTSPLWRKLCVPLCPSVQAVTSTRPATCPPLRNVQPATAVDISDSRQPTRGSSSAEGSGLRLGPGRPGTMSASCLGNVLDGLGVRIRGLVVSWPSP